MSKITNDWIWNYSYTEPDNTYNILAGERIGITELQREEIMIKDLLGSIEFWKNHNYDKCYNHLTRITDNLNHDPVELILEEYNIELKSWIKIK